MTGRGPWVRRSAVAARTDRELFALAVPALGALFTEDAAVARLATFVLILLAFQQPLNGLVFALDGILIGAGDVRFLARAMAGAAALFVPLAVGLRLVDAGLGWLWAALSVFMGARAVVLLARYRTDSWLVVHEGVQGGGVGRNLKGNATAT